MHIYFTGNRDEKVNRKGEDVLLKKRSKSSSLLSYFENQENIIYKPEFFSILRPIIQGKTGGVGEDELPPG
ncbi:hypothetical protein EO98_16820 [Methanosarcina sp. 2.H.T.1A.6]|nr:hypothetical protein EO97_10185 [Methanosarcina sp. 2.H.T.1A.15]KKG15026.1 hypothetical protein EO94_03875 [Methanosarcina sp. 2.H.T.1A.3]KKG20725.1 hypothetical protein EO96_17865 [Methanosarcina sp. 2.H.T.1A.8]KKG22042.1 hypothetical protein EO98_16820 [Methanosarcina sp. 2.H.T.1A.6]